MGEIGEGAGEAVAGSTIIAYSSRTIRMRFKKCIESLQSLGVFRRMGNESLGQECGAERPRQFLGPAVEL